MSNETEQREPLLKHMQELFVSIRWFIIFIFIGAGVGYVFSESIVVWLKEPFVAVMGNSAGLAVINAFDKVFVKMRVALWSGILFAAPGLYASIYYFVKPALLKRERRMLNVMLGVVLVVFWGGLFFGQAYTVPVLLKAVMGLISSNEVSMLGLSSYINVTVGAMIATALLFELPVMMFFLSYAGWVSSRVWSSSRRGAIVANAVVSAILSPPDVVSMLVMMVPIHVLYEVGILVSRMAEWRRNESR
ncbi:MAG: twin-arginine translocase subunit TatC [Bdellovibrionota bacterium]